MTITTIRSPPLLEDFTALEEHQSQTPSSFFNAKPILHFHSQSPMNILVPQNQLKNLHAFQITTGDTESSGSEDSGTLESIGSLNVFVSSQNLTLFNSSLGVGISIPYPSISLHAISSFPGTSSIPAAPKTLYMQLDPSDPFSMSDEDEPETIEFTILPNTPTVPSETNDEIQSLFTAISACSNLNPDPQESGDNDISMGEDGATQGDSRIRFEGSVGYEGISGLPGVSRGAGDGGLPPPFPGSGGWITSENVGEFFDADGNWIGGGDADAEAEAGEGDGIVILGEGAGRVRGRDEMEGEEEQGSNGINGHGEDENKWRRTS